MFSQEGSTFITTEYFSFPKLSHEVIQLVDFNDLPASPKKEAPRQHDFVFGTSSTKWPLPRFRMSMIFHILTYPSHDPKHNR